MFQKKIENLNTENLNSEKESLRKTNPFTIVEYIKNSIDILIDLKVEEKLDLERNSSINTKDDEERQNEYETLLRKLESDVRSHIKVK